MIVLIVVKGSKSNNNNNVNIAYLLQSPCSAGSVQDSSAHSSPNATATCERLLRSRLGLEGMHPFLAEHSRVCTAHKAVGRARAHREPLPTHLLPLTTSTHAPWQQLALCTCMCTQAPPCLHAPPACDHVNPCTVAARFNAIWLGDHANGALAFWVNLTCHGKDALQQGCIAGIQHGFAATL